MRERLRGHIPFLMLLALLSAFQIWGAQRVPFHPDESTYLYMSGDFDAWITEPGSLAFDPATPPDARGRYRAIDTPLLRYVVGLARSLAGKEALPVDWNWTQSWQANDSAGAVPVGDLLMAGRLALALLLPLTTTFLYLTADRIGGRPAALFAVALFGSHSLVLLHGRRVMSEGVLLFGLALVAWSLVEPRGRPWVLGLAAAIAVNAKHSALTILPMVALALVWAPEGRLRTGRAMIRPLASASLVFVIVTWLVNPFLWKAPAAALRYSAAERFRLLEEQVDTLAAFAPGQVLPSPAMRGLVAVGNLFILAPSFTETINYQVDLAAQIAEYGANPGHVLFRGLVAGGAIFALTLIGALLALARLRSASHAERRNLALLLLVSAIQLAALIALVPLSWQRYVTPLLPFVALWAGFGFGMIYRDIRSGSRKKLPVRPKEPPRRANLADSTNAPGRTGE